MGIKVSPDDKGIKELAMYRTRFVFWLAWGLIFLSLPWVLALTHLMIFGPTAFELGYSLEETLFTAFAIGLYALGMAAGLLILLGLIAQVTMAVWAIVFRGHALGFGERNIVENWLVHIAASADPPNVHNSDTKSFVVSGGGLRHAAYRDEVVRKNVAEFCDLTAGANPVAYEILARPAAAPVALSGPIINTVKGQLPGVL